jgi:hypothetical protein
VNDLRSLDDLEGVEGPHVQLCDEHLGNVFERGPIDSRPPLQEPIDGSVDIRHRVTSLSFLNEPLLHAAGQREIEAHDAVGAGCMTWIPCRLIEADNVTSRTTASIPTTTRTVMAAPFFAHIGAIWAAFGDLVGSDPRERKRVCGVPVDRLEVIVQLIRMVSNRWTAAAAWRGSLESFNSRLV